MTRRARLNSVGTRIPGLAKKNASYKLDKAGNRTQLKWPDGYYVNYGYDAPSRMNSATDSTGVALSTYAGACPPARRSRDRGAISRGDRA